MNAGRAAIARLLAAVLALAACLSAGAASAGPPARTEYRLDHERAHAAYRLEAASCKKLKANARDICKVQARSNFQLAKAQADVRHKPSPRNQDRLKLAQAQAQARLASEQCDDLRGNAREVCKADARASWVATHAQIRLSRTAVERGVYSRQAVGERKEARDDTAGALYAAARERCDALAGEQKASCVEDAKRKFGRL